MVMLVLDMDLLPQGSNPNASVFIYNDLYRYDPSNDSWQIMSQFPSQGRVAGTQFSYQGKGYVLSGDGDNHYPLGTSEFWEYDPITDSWKPTAVSPWKLNMGAR